ncbi:AarF/UbiB family protein [Streptomyces sp. NBC_01264]|uniref:AarF/UbiB family protein n=1 Tax=Streptomyces sp. NBC_01264 TaxID=2903804 RepID=UPI00338FBE33
MSRRPACGTAGSWWTAAVAQVHCATLPDGRRVVVKIQRPGIVRKVEQDLDIVRRVARSLDRHYAWARGHQLHRPRGRLRRGPHRGTRLPDRGPQPERGPGPPPATRPC